MKLIYWLRLTPLLRMILFTLGLTGAPAMAEDVVAGAADAHPQQSQTFFRMKDGTIEVILPETLTYTNKCDVDGKNCKEVLENAVWVFEKKNPLPATARMGANYATMKGDFLVTVSTNGGLWAKGVTSSFTPQAFTVGITGGNYFTKQGSNQLVTIDSSGFYNDTFITAGNIKVAGGNYFINDLGQLTTIKSSGAAPGDSTGQVTTFKAPPGTKPVEMNLWVFKNVAQVGGNFFVNADGSLVTVSSLTGLYAGPQDVPSKPVKVGGNYYVGQDNQIYTVDHKGVIAAKGTLTGAPLVYGYSFIIYSDGTFSIIAGDGSVHSSVAFISTTGVSRTIMKKIDLQNLDMTSIYLPGATQ